MNRASNHSHLAARVTAVLLSPMCASGAAGQDVEADERLVVCAVVPVPAVHLRKRLTLDGGCDIRLDVPGEHQAVIGEADGRLQFWPAG